MDTTLLREWQATAYETYMASQPADFLLVATPGAVKTLWALTVAHSLIPEKFDRVVVVVPTSHLKGQWASKAAEVDLHLDPEWSEDRGFEIKDYNGVVVTYQQVAASGNALVHRNQCGRRRTLVVFDEIHHAGESLAWGSSIRQAFDPATARLALSGTPFRSDNEPIPFINYDENRRSRPDFSFGYGDALRQGVCRPVLFVSFAGRIEFLSGSQVVNTTFEEALDPIGESRRLRTALDAKGEWIKSVMSSANDEMRRTRDEDQADAGGLVIAMDQRHARAIADELHLITGQRPILAVSDDPTASEQIRRFETGSMPWIVAVKMVSEGVDIPRLRVAVYATNVVSELFFRQAVGRQVRVQEGIDEQTSYFYIPEDERLTAFAQAIEEERDHALRDIVEEVRQWAEDGHGEDEGQFVPISAEAELGDVFFRQYAFTPEELARARKECIDMGFMPTQVTSVLSAAWLRRIDLEKAAVRGDGWKQPQTPLYQQRDRLRRVAHTLTRRLAGITRRHPKEINSDLYRAQGVSVERATISQLQ